MLFTTKVLNKYLDKFNVDVADFSDNDLETLILAGDSHIIKTFNSSKECREYFDTLLAAYLLDSTLVNNVDSIMHYFGVNVSSKKDESLSLFDNSDPERTCKIAYYSYKVANKALSDLDILECLKL